ncbi:MAG TPA: exonuclease SbcCD subunit D [Candidatus Acidoferrum sp.]|nr:exonuclease SbcCD subunit D [Candidatus Acidoferrum sp.]
MSIQILLTADNHLDPPAASFGPRRFERRQDHLKCFEEVIEYATKNRPDFLLLAGDLFDTVRPGNLVRAKVMEDLKALHDLGVRILAVSGDHDTPKVAEEGSSPLAVYGNSGYVHFFQNPSEFSVRRFSVDGLHVEVGGLSRNPLLASSEDPLANASVHLGGDVNIILTHYPVEGFVGYSRDDPIIKLSSFPPNCQLVCVGHFHSYQTKELQHTTVIYPGSTERASFQEENEEKGFVWVELGREGVVSREHIKTSARPFKTVDVFFPDDPAPMEILKQVLDESENHQAAVRLRLRGRVTAERLSKYRRSELILQNEGKFFHLAVDEGDLEIESPEPIQALPRTTPLEELRRHFAVAIESSTGEEKEILEEALRLCQAKLEEAGAW